MDESSIPIHPKVWGEEHWVVNREYCGKKLVLRRGFRCSMHHHQVKDETFYVISGRVLLEFGNEVRVLAPGQKQHIPAGLVHRFTGLTDSEVIEFSTHHSESDTYRTSLSERVPAGEFKALLEKFPD
ncbi:MAG: cupin domain-containing protein [Planctomycetes bacterium]|nr:cupin domain-containing protein [Planctomycetota bacterium]